MSIGFTAGFLIAVLAVPAVATEPSDDSSGLQGGHMVTICHATSSDDPADFWQVITVDIASSGGPNKLNGHLEHASDPNKRDGRGDAIPEFSYGGQSYGGVGLDQEGLPEVCAGPGGIG
jgi:hypothetical protein